MQRDEKFVFAHSENSDQRREIKLVLETEFADSILEKNHTDTH